VDPREDAATYLCTSDGFDRDVVDQLVDIDGSGDTLRTLAALFVRDAPPRVDALRAAIMAGDVDEARRCAHGIKGSASMFGARRLTDAALALETAARSGKLPADDGVVAVADAMVVVADALRRYAEGSGSSSSL